MIFCPLDCTTRLWGNKISLQYPLPSKKPIHHPVHNDGGADRCYACLALELGKDWNNRTMYAVDVAITRIGPGHHQPTKTAFRIAHQGH